MKNVAAVVVTYNRKEKLMSCLNALTNQASGTPDILVVDNHSSDGTYDAIKGLIETGAVRYFNTGYNSGGAGGFCYGVRKAIESGYDFVWLMDDDCVPAEDALQKFLEFDASHKGEYGYLSSKVLWKDGNICKMNIQRETVTRNVRDWDRDVIGIEMASFVSLFIPAAIVKEVGLPLRKFFIWTDDWEYTRRISAKYPCYLVTASTVLHDTNENVAAHIHDAPSDRIWRFRYLYRNDVYLYRREGLRGLCYEAARLTLHLGRIAASGNNFAEKIKRAGILMKGTAEGLRFYPEPERANSYEYDNNNQSE